jgi:hypothetical protein
MQYATKEYCVAQRGLILSRPRLLLMNQIVLVHHNGFDF